MMYRGLNARGLSLLSNNISSASDLPPLNPSSGTVYQPPSSTGARNALIETQRMRTLIMGQIQSIQSEQDRKMQQSEARISMVLRELSPKIQNLDRHITFNQQQLNDIIERLTQLDSVVLPSIQQKSDEVQLKFEQSIRTETQSKFKPISDDIKHEQTKSEQLSDSTTSHISSTNDKLKDLSIAYDELERKASDTQNYVQSNLININPRLSAIEARLVTYESAAESSIKSQSSQSDLQLSAKKLRKDLEELELDGIPLAVQSAASDTLTSITSFTSQIDQKITSSKLLLSNVESTIKMTAEQQKNVDSQVESLSKSSIDIQTNIEQEELEIDTKLKELENSIKEINDEIVNKLNTLQNDNSGDSQLVLDTLNDDIRSLQSNAKQLLTQLNQDWTRFHKDNGEAQKITDSEIDQLSSILNGEFSLLKKIAAAERRVKWCSSRLLAWEKEVEEAERLKVDDENLVQKLETLEARLKETESRIAVIDKQKAPKLKKLTKESYNENGPAPTLASPGNEIEPLTIPSELILTYDDNDTEIVIPDLPSHADRKMNPAKFEKEQPDANPPDGNEIEEDPQEKQSKYIKNNDINKKDEDSEAKNGKEEDVEIQEEEEDKGDEGNENTNKKDKEDKEKDENTEKDENKENNDDKKPSENKSKSKK
ncbi:hypothetical protein M9Y10_038968 [Tritrichomonas musculus]|uniref:Autophagy-related protein 23 n=1 Tax=Tritrichomonas musculus TaxID=1915356 RepID=A0ABR2K9W4_9EUKA